MSILRALQAHVEALHNVSTDLDVTAFVVDEAGRAALPGALPDIDEQLFVRDEGDAVALSVYIAPHVVAALERDDPQRRLHDGNLDPFCVALEGVSHFVCLAWRAEVAWPVTALELEIQAEIDKFLLAWAWLSAQGMPPAAAGQALLVRLFGRYSLHAAVLAAEAERYHLANRVARGFCQRLLRAAGANEPREAAFNRARAFQRRSLADKLRQAG